MQYSDVTNKQGIVEDISFLVFGDSGDHSAEFPLADVARLVNRWYDKCVIKILQADSQWQWDDTNKTDLPIADIDLASGQQDYGISAATYLKVSRIECRDAAGNWVRLRAFQEDELGDTADRAFLNTPATPRYYRLQASSVFLYPAPNYSVAAAMRVFYQRNVDYFTAADTTKVPGFAEMFHRILSLGAAKDYAMTVGMSQKVNAFNGEITAMMQDLELFYSTRNDSKLSLKLHRTDYGESELGAGYGGISNNGKGFFQ